MAYYYEDQNGATDSKYVNASMKVKRNRLRYVNDGTNYDANDIDPGMASTNYGYDAEGRLAVDVQEKITRITWRVDGKIRKIERPAGATQKNLIFDYDALGHRIAKHVYSSNNVWEKSTYYVLDAQGNTMATYEHVNNSQTQTITFAQTEKHIYGSSRLGTNTKAVPLFGSQNATYAMRSVVHYTGKRSYELTNHLNNVLSVISDKVIPHQNGSSVDYWLADIRQSSDYSPFGVLLKNRDLPLTSGSGNVPYRYGYQGSERDDEVKGEGNSINYEFRMHDPRIGRFFAIDPLANKYADLSPYGFTANNPIQYIEKDGRDFGIYYDKETKTITIKATYHTVKSQVVQQQKVVDRWNKESGSAYYRTGSKKTGYEYYKINFELKVSESAEPRKSGTNDPEGNSVQVVKDGEGVFDDGHPNRRAATAAKERIYIRESRVDDLLPQVHELGHTLIGGNGHFPGTVMNESIESSADNLGIMDEINLPIISAILATAGLGSKSDVNNNQGSSINVVKGSGYDLLEKGGTVVSAKQMERQMNRQAKRNERKQNK